MQKNHSKSILPFSFDQHRGFPKCNSTKSYLFTNFKKQNNGNFCYKESVYRISHLKLTFTFRIPLKCQTLLKDMCRLSRTFYFKYWKCSVVTHFKVLLVSEGNKTIIMCCFVSGLHKLDSRAL